MYRPSVRVTITLDPAARRKLFLFRRALFLNVTAVLLSLSVIVPVLFTHQFARWAPFAIVVAFVLLFLAFRDTRRARQL